MPHKPGTIEALAQVVARTSRGVRPLCSVPEHTWPAASLTTYRGAPSRASCIARIRLLEQAFGLGWMTEQATFGTTGLRALGDDEIRLLLLAMERARECSRDGIPLDDAGFLQDISSKLHAL